MGSRKRPDAGQASLHKEASGGMRSRFPPSVLGRVKGELERGLMKIPGLRWAYLYGSAARGEAFADADVAIMPAEGTFERLTEAGELGAELSRGLGLEGLTVEVIDLRSCTLPFLDAMLDDALVLTDREPEARRFWEAGVTLRWLDFKPLWELNERLRRKGLMEGEWSSAIGPKGS